MPSYEYQTVKPPWFNTSNRFAVLIGYDTGAASGLAQVLDPNGAIISKAASVAANFSFGSWTVTQAPVSGRFTHQTTGVPNTFIDNTNTVDDAGTIGTITGSIPVGSYRAPAKLLIPPNYQLQGPTLAMIVICATLDDAVAIL